MPRMTPKRFLRLFLGYFLKGILYTVPLAIVIYAIVVGFIYIDSLMPVEVPGLGVVVLIALITVAGFLGSTLLGRFFRSYFTKIIDRAPILKSIYNPIKDVFSGLIGSKKKRGFKRPVLVKLNKQSDIERLGFITADSLEHLGVAEGKVAVYVPFSLSVSADLFIVPAENVKPIDAKPADVMKFIMSGGIVELEANKKEPEDSIQVPDNDKPISLDK